MAADRRIIMNIFEELSQEEYKKAAVCLKDHGVKGRAVDKVKDGEPHDMADLILKQFDIPKGKTVIRDILEQAQCQNVIRDYERFLSPGDEEIIPPSYPQAVLNKRNTLYDNLNKELGKDEEHRLRGLLDGCQLKKGELEKLRDVADILKELDRQGCFTPNYKFLESLLDQIGRAPLKRYIREYELGLNN